MNVVESSVSPSLPRPSSVAVWVAAARPKTLTAAWAPVIVGAAVAAHEGVFLAWPVALALLGATLIQIGTNFANDYYDYRKGADTADRVGPVRVTQAGWIAPTTVRNVMVATFAAAMLVGVGLVHAGGWPIVWLGLASIASGVAYTGGKYALAYTGLGDVFVFAFFGVAAVCGTYWVQAQAWSWLALVCAIPLGALATAILAVNNLRDVHTDAPVGKRTLAVRFGAQFARWEYTALAAVAVVVPVALAVIRHDPLALLPLLTLPFAIPPLRSVWRDAGAALNPTLGATARWLLVYAVAQCVWLLLSRST